MDFDFSEEQRQIIELARKVFSEHASHERVRELEKRGGLRFDPELWRVMAEAGLLGVTVPEEHGGAGLGFLEIAGVLQEVGRRAAPVPYLETQVLGVLPVRRFGSAEQQARWLEPVARGELVLTAALQEDAAPPDRPQAAAEATASGFRLRGRRPCVPAGPLAGRILVPATADGEVGIFAVDPKAEGVRVTPLRTTSGQPEAVVELEGAPVAAEDVLVAPGPEGAEALEWIRQHATAALAVLAVGLCEEALRLTAEYTKTRKQFDQPIAMFQAVGHRAADAYIDTEAVRLSAWQAAWRLAEELPAEREVAIAKFWASEGGNRVVHAAQHLHGGVGVDREYPLHRYFLMARQLELTLGGATEQLLRLGEHIASSPPPEPPGA